VVDPDQFFEAATDLIFSQQGASQRVAESVLTQKKVVPKANGGGRNEASGLRMFRISPVTKAKTNTMGFL
jgi:hypothetical protein